jgi:conjugative transfer ATPase
VLQLFVQDETRLEQLTDQLIDYAKPDAKASKFSQHWFSVIRAHLADVSRPGGLFTDDLVTGTAWQGKTRRVRAVLYRPRSAGLIKTEALTSSDAGIQELNDVMDRLMAGLESAGIHCQRSTGTDLYQWLFRWFNPCPETTQGDTEALLALASYPSDKNPDNVPYGWDFSEQLLSTPPGSDPEQGIWWFDQLPHRAIVVQGLRHKPPVGLFTHERPSGDRVFALFDRMPEHTIMATTITIQPQDLIRSHLLAIQKAAFGDYADAKIAGNDAQLAQMAVARGNKLYPTQISFFVRGTDTHDLKVKSNQVNALLLSNNVQPIREQDDLYPLDSYLRNLPMNYEPQFDKKHLHRSRLVFSQHIASLTPLFGRSTGSGNPGVLFFNRGGEPVMFDPLNLYDRKKNGHLLLLGPTGSGKSATLIYLLLQMLAVYRPRICLIESGNSFGLLGDYLKTQGFSVNAVRLTPSADVSLPPFQDALKLLEVKGLDFDPEDELSAADNLDEDEERDILGEMEISARIMITGGEEREEARLTRADRRTIRSAIYAAAEHAQAQGREYVLTSDVERALRQINPQPHRGSNRAEEMADALGLFCSPGSFEAHLFNRPGKAWPDVDVTIVDLGLLAREGYQDKLTVAYIGLMNTINHRVERFQNDSRPTLVITDEGHLITTNPLLSPYVIKITKMWRKLGAWFWIATQNLEDFPDAARRMLTMLEWWLCLVMPKDEITQIARFRHLTDEQAALLLAAKKSPGKYTEGVVLTDHFAALFRNVPPAIALALGMTEKEEKAERARLMQAHQCTELDAVLLVAAQIAKKRGQS